MADLENRILEFVARPNYQPVKPRVIAKKLGIERDDLPDFKRLLKRLVKAGRLAYGASHLVLPVTNVGHAVRAEEVPEVIAEPHDGSMSPGENPRTISAPGTHSVPYEKAVASKPSKNRASSHGLANHVTGVFRRAQAGFGFVRPTNSAPQADRKLDIFIPADRTLDAASGDTVLVRLQRHRDVRRPNPVGEVVEVLDARLTSSSARTSRAAAMLTPRWTARFSIVRFCSAIRARKAPSPTTKSFSRWSASRRTIAMAKG